MYGFRRSRGEFESREVELGIKGENKYEILSGLKEGELVAASGGFLIDSESQLRSGNTGTHGHSGSEPMEQKENKDKDLHEGSSMDKKMGQINSGIWNTVCPVKGEEVDPEVRTVTYRDKVIGFCCAGCDEEFRKDPDEYLKHLNNNGTEYLSLN